MSNLSNIGFSVETEEDFHGLAEKAFEKGNHVKVNGGKYIVYTDESLAQIWLQMNNKNEFIGLNPHFKGKSKRKVSLTSSVERNDSDLDFALHAWANPSQKEDPQSGMYPFVFDVPNGKEYGDIKFPQEMLIQLTAFAQELEVFEDEDDFHNKEEGEVKWAAHSFVPSGLFNPSEGSTTTPPQSFGLFAGTIKQYKKRKNRMTGEEFYWMLVDTLGGEIDVVADQRFFVKEPKIKGVVFGQFWLSGQLLKTPEQNAKVKKSFLSKLFGK